MTRIKPLYFGSKKLESGFGHRIHRSKKRRTKLLVSKFHYKQRKKDRALKEEKMNRDILRRERQLISTTSVERKKRV